MRTFVYVDGFNLYYGALKGSPWKWLDLVALFDATLQAHHEILAVHMLNDGWLNAYECAVVVTNDSDIAEAMRLLKLDNCKRIGLVTPGTGRPSRQLMAHADFSRPIRPNVLRRSQLPDPIPGTNISKPPSW